MNKIHLFITVLKTWESKIKVLADLVFDGAQLLVYRLLPSLSNLSQQKGVRELSGVPFMRALLSPFFRAHP